MRKWIAAFLMLLDHIAYFNAPILPAPLYVALRLAGRLAFPIFCYDLVLGYRLSRHLPRYFSRLLGFAIVTQLLMHLAAAWRRPPGSAPFVNVMFTLAAGLVLIVGLDFVTRSMSDLIMMLRPATAGARGACPPTPPNYHLRTSLGGITLPAWQGVLIGLAAILASLSSVYLLRPDYDFTGLAIIVLFHTLMSYTGPWRGRENRQRRLRWLLRWWASLALLLLATGLFSLLAQRAARQWILIGQAASLAIPLICLTERRPPERPPRWQQYFFYVFYPLHLFILILFART